MTTSVIVAARPHQRADGIVERTFAGTDLGAIAIRAPWKGFPRSVGAGVGSWTT